jgi:predicted Zn-dependent protease
MEERPRRAIEILDQPVIRDRSSVLTNLLLAQAYAQLGDRDRAGEYLAVVEERSPQLAAQYAGLAGPARARASDATERPMLPWAAEDNE